MLRIIIRSFLIILSILIISVTTFAVLFDTQFRSDPYIGEVTDHFDGEKFSNIGGEIVNEDTPKENRFRAFFDDVRGSWEKKAYPTTLPDQSYTGTGIKITHVGHSTLLIQGAGFNILTDPIWSDSPSPFPGVWPKRFSNPWIHIDALPKIDIILLSHNHYDHMDIPTLEYLEAKHHPLIITWLWNGAYLAKYGIMNTLDLDWFETYTKKSKNSETVIHFVPAQHYSRRAVSDKNNTLWGWFVLEINKKKVYFTGDTGYGAFIPVLQEHFPEWFDVGMVSIGAFRPRVVMKENHTTPEEAIQMQKELKIKQAIGIHWGTFNLGTDGQTEAGNVIQEKNAENFDSAYPGKEWIIH